jgi:hypothetical protein
MEYPASGYIIHVRTKKKAREIAMSKLNEERYRQLVEYLRSARRGEASYPSGFTANEKRGLRQQAASFEEKGGILYYRSQSDSSSVRLRRVVVGEAEQERLIRACHDGVDGGHFGRDKTLGKAWQEMLHSTAKLVMSANV